LINTYTNTEAGIDTNTLKIERARLSVTDSLTKFDSNLSYLFEVINDSLGEGANDLVLGQAFVKYKINDISSVSVGQLTLDYSLFGSKAANTDSFNTSFGNSLNFFVGRPLNLQGISYNLNSKAGGVSVYGVSTGTDEIVDKTLYKDYNPIRVGARLWLSAVNSESQVLHIGTGGGYENITAYYDKDNDNDTPDEIIHKNGQHYSGEIAYQYKFITTEFEYDYLKEDSQLSKTGFLEDKLQKNSYTGQIAINLTGEKTQYVSGIFHNITPLKKFAFQVAFKGVLITDKENKDSDVKLYGASASLIQNVNLRYVLDFVSKNSEEKGKDAKITSFAIKAFF
jgi:hypothetical protein